MKEMAVFPAFSFILSRRSKPEAALTAGCRPCIAAAGAAVPSPVAPNMLWFTVADPAGARPLWPACAVTRPRFPGAPMSRKEANHDQGHYARAGTPHGG